MYLMIKNIIITFFFGNGLKYILLYSVKSVERGHFWGADNISNVLYDSWVLNDCVRQVHDYVYECTLFVIEKK